ncbi:DUF4328 domain-containing protein [Agrobacterium vitis]|uniref:DUF4328 domain-containing protein n=1 Tax=Agrobacterium vitis TaxID=373 RepID=UPI00087212EC|nr:DUF4328 domain-containing protein [Agrobacterium vitis]MCE6074892.1 DUF4328 domain-containing protein [Agrobacterium vitis]MCM2450966.1 DUF4328 domain-containing protein [Agrobacterium vitis]MCM2467703.1 DUF4328 domain-containing protein [Agrobacterium vitis]MUO68392.1 DUF4328 domain-containing protein [Agrobacterium vitis]MUO83390.1 DUF4328 domain-containing protein [Agrobacterium vitis]
MTLDTLLRRMTWMRRGWLVLAALCGVLYFILVPFFLYTAWVQYVVAATGFATYTGVTSWLAQGVGRWAAFIEVGAVVFRVASACFWLAWLWFAVHFAARLSPDAPPRLGPWVSVICWFVPIIKYIFPQVVMMEIARITMRDDHAPPEGQAPDHDLPVLNVRDLYWLVPSILVCNLVSLTVMNVVSQAVADQLQFSAHSQHILHLAAAGGVASLLSLLAMDAYARTMAKAQETRLARLFLDRDLPEA